MQSAKGSLYKVDGEGGVFQGSLKIAGGILYRLDSLYRDHYIGYIKVVYPYWGDQT